MEIVGIKSIKKIDIKSKRHDIEVEDNHNFFADDILVHNSNFSFWYDGVKMKYAKRTGFIDATENFFNYEEVATKENPKIIAMWDFIKSEIKDFGMEFDLGELVVYGELFGGTYPHPDVPRNPHATAVQKGLFYSPTNEFYCFDIKVNGRLLGETQKGELCEQFGIFWDEPLFEGTFNECLKYPNLFPTTIPKRLGLPEIEGNVCEGVVIKPIEVKRSWAGNRVIFKNKNEKYAEITGKKSGEKSMKQPKEAIELSEAGNELLETLMQYVNENRLNAVISKLGELNDKMFGKIVGECMGDTMNDFLKDERESFEALDLKEQKVLTKRMGAEWSNMIRADFLNILDNSKK
ncbi:MAG: RNA ligase family protein [Candidatus Pacearchaeota archaeon]|jgi:Rnl2 family RNA ligase|nr:hypothetical protein [Clostridia bacterium]